MNVTYFRRPPATDGSTTRVDPIRLCPASMQMRCKLGQMTPLMICKFNLESTELISQNWIRFICYLQEFERDIHPTSCI